MITNELNTMKSLAFPKFGHKFQTAIQNGKIGGGGEIYEKFFNFTRFIKEMQNGTTFLLIKVTIYQSKVKPFTEK